MGIRDNFSQAMRELGLKSKDNSNTQNGPQIRDVASYMNTDDTTSAESLNARYQQSIPKPDPVQETAPEETEGFPESGEFYDEEDEEEAAGGFSNTEPVQNQYQQGQYQQNQYQQNMNQGYNAPQSDPYRRTYGQQTAQNEGSEEITVISKNTIIDGNVRSFADMEISGNIRGNVETTKNICVNGKIVGDVTCDNAVLKTSAIQGNLNLKGQISMSSDAMLIGDLNTQIARINGKVKGNLNITGKAQLDRDSVVYGNVRANTISISDGAIIEGYVSTTFLTKEESSNIFPEKIVIGD